jgi:hypothetical protein
MNEDTAGGEKSLAGDDRGIPPFEKRRVELPAAKAAAIFSATCGMPEGIP